MQGRSSGVEAGNRLANHRALFFPLWFRHTRLLSHLAAQAINLPNCVRGSAPTGCTDVSCAIVVSPVRSHSLTAHARGPPYPASCEIVQRCKIVKQTTFVEVEYGPVKTRLCGRHDHQGVAIAPTCHEICDRQTLTHMEQHV